MMLRARIEVYRGARKARFPLKPLYRTDRYRDTHIALCRTAGQAKRSSTCQARRSERAATLCGLELCMCISGRTQANVVDQDTTQVTATCQRNRAKGAVCVSAVVAIRGIGVVGGTNETVDKVKCVCGVRKRGQRGSLQL